MSEMRIMKRFSMLTCFAIVLTWGICAAEDSRTPLAAFTIVSKLVHDDAFSGAHDVELSGHLAFVPGKGGSNAIVDIDRFGDHVG